MVMHVCSWLMRVAELSKWITVFIKEGEKSLDGARDSQLIPQINTNLRAVLRLPHSLFAAVFEGPHYDQRVVVMKQVEVARFKNCSSAKLYEHVTFS
jgi:hypothetical protein